MKIFSPGIKEGLLYQRTTVYLPSRTLLMRKQYSYVLTEPIDEWINSVDWGTDTEEERIKKIQSEIE